MQTTSTLNRKSTYLLVSFFGSIFVVIFTGRLASLFPTNDWPFALGVIFLALIAAVIPVTFKRKNWACPSLILLGIPVGVFLDVMWDDVVNSIGRSLFPIEIVMWLMISVIPIFIGFIVGRRMVNCQP